jgi:hypothetical protein
MDDRWPIAQRAVFHRRVARLTSITSAGGPVPVESCGQLSRGLGWSRTVQLSGFSFQIPAWEGISRAILSPRGPSCWVPTFGPNVIAQLKNWKTGAAGFKI